MHEFDQLVAGDAYFMYCTKALTWSLSFTNPTTQFTYDGDGGRVKKSVFQPANTKSQITLGDTVYVGSLYEVESSGKTTKHIFAGANKVCAIEKTASTSEMYYFHSDHLGSSNLVTNDTGTQVGLTQFSPYGSTFKQTGTYDPKHKFTGKEFDPSTGLYYYGARYYDAQLGRFTQADTIVQAPYDPQSLNRYTYCRNNPINLVDPTGHSWMSKWWGKLVGAVAGIVGTLLTGNMMVGFQIFNFFSSLQSTISSGNWGAFAGGIAGGLIGGYVGGGLAGKVSGFLGEKAFTFGGGFMVGATEMGIGGFGGSFGGSLGGGSSFGEAMKQGAIGLGIGAAVGGLIEGSYLSGMQNVAHGMSRQEVYVAGIKRIHALSVNATDKTTAIVGSRPLETKDNPGPFRHRYIRGRAGHFEMGPDQNTGLIELNGEGSFSGTEYYLKNFPSKVLEQTVVVSQSGFYSSVNLYKAAWVGTKYEWFNCNSNFAVNTVIYGSGANVPQDLGLTPIGIDHYK